MLSNYFKLKTASDEFKERIELIFEELKDKKVLIYGAGEAYIELNKRYNFKETLNVVAVADKKFENKKYKNIYDIKTISPNDIKNLEFDFVLITNEFYEPINKFLTDKLEIPEDKIRIILKQDIRDERVNLNYLFKMKFDKTLPKLIKKLKDKKVLVYGGAGCCFQVMQKYFDLSELNIVAIADYKYSNHKKDDNNKYVTCSPENIKDFNPDCILIANKYWIDVMKSIYLKILYSTDIKVIPLIKKPLFVLLKEIFC